MEQDKEAAAKRKKKGLLPLEEKMGLDKTTEKVAPPAPPPDLARPGMFPGAAASSLQKESGELGDRIRTKLKGRRGAE